MNTYRIERRKRRRLNQGWQSFWSAATRRRFFRSADLSAKQRRVERRAKQPEPSACFRIVRSTTFDGDKSPAESGENSPHSKGFAVIRTTQTR